MYDMKDVRILWNDNILDFNAKERPKITELIVHKFIEDEEDDSMHLYDKYMCDIGNCLSDWDNWKPIQIILHFYVNYGFVSKEVEKESLFQLMKINELKSHMEQILAQRGWLEI